MLRCDFRIFGNISENAERSVNSSGMTTEVVIADTLEGIGGGDVSLHLAHILCLGGSCEIGYNGKTFQLHEKDCAVIRATQLIEKVIPDEDFRVEVVYVTPVFIEKATPNNNYGMRGSLSLSLNPVLHLNDEEFERLADDFREIRRRRLMVWHRFMEDQMLCVVQMMILDLFDIHARIYGRAEVQSQTATIMQRFIGMLERGDYRRNRKVTYYASELCVAPKYLSEISKSVTGHSANWWINRFTILDISRQLRDRSRSFVDISELFNFSSPAYFSRYVQRYLGQSPSAYRG
jgi:AraC family transcriptional activator of pobA